MTHLVYLEKRPLQVFLLLLQIMLLLVLNLQIRAVKFMISLTDVYFLPVAFFWQNVCIFFSFGSATACEEVCAGVIKLIG